ncbi:hypothetical protein [Enterococcus faecalis]|uniref:hypothetical protein n=1 Tax=Enterococcus faecalis TaxID=1351 RepID=UPI0021DFD520|nr:hypothetical protein [Enterococcus faecalis]MCU9758222.1 hypothetical protein [Enterococcus faecalis]MCU9772606.1 hypothetical protein [Enterococcus faecalis]MCU9772821.1 hypothetical protein [Enterococcus faecalis]MCU9792143.1 hypothetical protein [Enterococcus faecalis]HEC4826999.1 hypothetical protein [Enterococcus faecalis]
MPKSISLLANIYFTYELARRLQKIAKEITVNAFNPGMMTETNFSGRRGKIEISIMKKWSAN